MHTPKKVNTASDCCCRRWFYVCVSFRYAANNVKNTLSNDANSVYWIILWIVVFSLYKSTMTLRIESTEKWPASKLSKKERENISWRMRIDNLKFIILFYLSWAVQCCRGRCACCCYYYYFYLNANEAVLCCRCWVLLHCKKIAKSRYTIFSLMIL